MESKVDQFTRGFFWCGYVVFLSASIPHIAAYFRHFDPNATGAEDVFWWVIAYALAIVIDLSDVLISIAVMRAMARGETFKQLWSFWAFIAFIMVLSWFFNWQYDVVNETHTFANVDKVLLFNWITVGTVNPIIGSAFQVLLLVYTAMAHKFAHKPVEKTAAELQLEADEMAAKDVQLARLEALKKTQKQRRRETFFEEIKQAKESALQVVKKEPVSAKNGGVAAPDIEDDLTTNQGVNEDDIEEETEEQDNTYQPLQREHLGMIEKMMYDKVVKDMDVLVELLSLAFTMPISDLTLSLQCRFSSHANYITEARVCSVFEAVKNDYSDLVSEIHTDDLGPSTDPEQVAISAANENAFELQENVTEGTTNHQRNDGQERQEMPVNITSISQANRKRITRDLSEDMPANQGGKKGAYAITKQAAAEALGCPISEIERGISEGIIKPFAKDQDKVLRTSVQNFIPQKRTRRTAKVANK